MKTVKKAKDFKQVAKVERKWASQAHKEGVEEKRAAAKDKKKGMPELAKEMNWDSKKAEEWKRMRLKRAAAATAKARKTK
jgi:hypothetical protein